MAYSVTQLVRRARLPGAIANRPVAKLVLLSLADRCDHDGRNAWPALATICSEAEIGSRVTARAHLDALRRHGLIHEQEPPLQHRPRVWQLDLDAIRQLIPDVPEGQPVDRLDSTNSGDQPDNRDGQPGIPDGQLTASDGQPVVPDPVLLNGPLNRDRTFAPAPRAFERQAKEPNGTNFFVIRKIAIELLQVTGKLGFGDLVERVKEECANRQIEAVPTNVVHRACVSAEFEVLLKPKIGILASEPANRRGTAP